MIGGCRWLWARDRDSRSAMSLKVSPVALLELRLLEEEASADVAEGPVFDALVAAVSRGCLVRRVVGGF